MRPRLLMRTVQHVNDIILGGFPLGHARVRQIRHRQHRNAKLLLGFLEVHFPLFYLGRNRLHLGHFGLKLRRPFGQGCHRGVSRLLRSPQRFNFL